MDSNTNEKAFIEKEKDLEQFRWEYLGCDTWRNPRDACKYTTEVAWKIAKQQNTNE